MSSAQRSATTHTATPVTLQRRFLKTDGIILNGKDTVTVRLNLRAYSPLLRAADIPKETIVPWWGGRRLRFQYARTRD